MATTVAELMTSSPIVVDAGAEVRECAQLMEHHDIGVVGVVREGRLFGVLTDRDIVIRAVAIHHIRDPRAVTAGEIASPDAITVQPEATLEEAEGRMREHAVRRLFIVDDAGTPVGILSWHDLAAFRDPGSIAARQIREWSLWASDRSSGD